MQSLPSFFTNLRHVCQTCYCKANYWTLYMHPYSSHLTKLVKLLLLVLSKCLTIQHLAQASKDGLFPCQFVFIGSLKNEGE